MKRFYKPLMCLLGSIILIFLVSFFYTKIKELKEPHNTAISEEPKNTGIFDTEESEIIQLEKEEQIQDETNDIEILKKQIKSGDFSNLKESEDNLSEQIKNSFTIAQKALGIDWVECDIDGDDINELIWQDKESYNENMKRIVGIFSFQLDGVTCILWDIFDCGEYYFLSKNGNIIYYSQYYGTYNYNGYEHYQFDNEGKKKFVDGLYIYNISNFSEVDVVWWYEEHPDMLSEGIYYKKHIIEPGEKEGIEDNLDEEEFFEAFEEMTGNSFDNLKPEWITD